MEKSVLMYTIMWLVFLSILIIKFLVELYFRKFIKEQDLANQEKQERLFILLEKKYFIGLLVYRAILYVCTGLLFFFAPVFIWEPWIYGLIVISVYTLIKLLLNYYDYANIQQ